MNHWTEVQMWQHRSEVVSAGELIKRYGQFLREHELNLIDRPMGTRVQMKDMTIWSRVK